jgi:hypothetical protein
MDKTTSASEQILASQVRMCLVLMKQDVGGPSFCERTSLKPLEMGQNAAQHLRNINAQ